MATVREELERLFTFWPESKRHAGPRQRGDAPIRREVIEDFERLRDALFVLADRMDGRPAFKYDDPVRVDLRGLDYVPQQVDAEEVEATIAEVYPTQGTATVWYEPIRNYIRRVPLERITPRHADTPTKAA